MEIHILIVDNIKKLCILVKKLWHDTMYFKYPDIEELNIEGLKVVEADTNYDPAVHGVYITATDKEINSVADGAIENSKLKDEYKPLKRKLDI